MICEYANDVRGCIEVHQNGPDVTISWSLFIHEGYRGTKCVAASSGAVDDMDDAIEQCDAAYEEWESRQ